MKLVFKLFLAVLAGILLGYVTLIDSIVEQIVEQEGSKVIKAKLEIGEAEFHLFPPSITLHDVAATNPQDPLRNIIVSTQITALINNQALFNALRNKKLIIDSVTVNGLRFQQVRKSSGAIEGLTPPLISSVDNNLPTLASESSSIIENTKHALQGKLDIFNKQTIDIRMQWQQKSELFTRNNKIDIFRKRWAELQNAGTSEKLNGLRQLKKDIATELTAVKKNHEDIQIDLAVTGEIEQQAKQLINTTPDSVAIQNTANTELTNALTDKLLADKLKNSVNELLAIYKASSNNAPTSPVLLKQLSFNGQIELGVNALPIEGKIDNLNNSHNYWQLPTTISATQSANASGKLLLSGSFDHRNPQSLNDSAEITLEDVTITALSLSRAKDMRVVLGQANASVNGKFSLRNNQLSLQIDNQFKNAQITIETNVNGSSNGPLSNNALTTNLSESLRNIDRFNLTITATGDINNAAIHASSSLEQLLQSAASQSIKTAQDAIQPELNAAMQNAFDTFLNELKTTQQQLDSISNSLNNYIQDLNNLISTF